jgi:hypothetical protein
VCVSKALAHKLLWEHAVLKLTMWAIWFQHCMLGEQVMCGGFGYTPSQETGNMGVLMSFRCDGKIPHVKVMYVCHIAPKAPSMHSWRASVTRKWFMNTRHPAFHMSPSVSTSSQTAATFEPRKQRICRVHSNLQSHPCCTVRLSRANQ